jgi:hypothetical protein
VHVAHNIKWPTWDSLVCGRIIFQRNVRTGHNGVDRIQWMDAGTLGGCSLYDSDTYFLSKKVRTRLISFSAVAPTVVITYLIVSTCGPLGRLHFLPLRQTKILLHFCPKTLSLSAALSYQNRRILYPHLS